MTLRFRTKLLTTGVVVFLMPELTVGEIIKGTDEQAQLPFWEIRTENMALRLVQRLPDQTRAYFAGRGFNKKDVGHIANYCIFQTVFQNIAAPESKRLISYDAKDWRIVHNGKEQPLVLREDWRRIWQQRGAQQPQRIAFEWSLLPTQQRYQPADYNWGMTVYELPHGARFDLNIVWSADGNRRVETIKDIECAKDIYIAPATE